MAGRSHVDGALLAIDPSPSSTGARSRLAVRLRRAGDVEGTWSTIPISAWPSAPDRKRAHGLQELLALVLVAVDDERRDREDQDGSDPGADDAGPADPFFRLRRRRSHVRRGVGRFVAHGCTYLSESCRNGSPTGTGRAAREEKQRGGDRETAHADERGEVRPVEPEARSLHRGITTQYRSM